MSATVLGVGGEALQGRLWGEVRVAPCQTQLVPAGSAMAPPQGTAEACQRCWWHLWESVFKEGQNTAQQWEKGVIDGPVSSWVREEGVAAGTGGGCSPWSPWGDPGGAGMRTTAREGPHGGAGEKCEEEWAAGRSCYKLTAVIPHLPALPGDTLGEGSEVVPGKKWREEGGVLIFVIVSRYPILF